MVRAPRYGYQQGYASWQRQPLWQEGERIDKWNPYYRQDLTGADEEISLEDVEGGKPPTYVPQIDRQALGYKDVLGPRNHPWQALSETLPPAAGYGDIYDQIGETNRRNRGLGGLIRRVNPFDNAQPPPAPPAGFVNERPFEGNMPRPRPQSWNEEPQETIGTYGGPADLIAPPDKPQQDTQSVAAVFGGPQSGASSMLEDPRGETSRKRYDAARIAREAFSRDPGLVKEFLPKLQDAGVDPGLGAPEGWSLPEAPETWPATPGFGTETEAERAARRAEQEAAYRRDTFPPGTGIPGPAVPGGPRPGEPLIMPPRGSPVSPLSPDYGIGGGMSPGNFGRAPQPRPEEQGPPAPVPFAGNMPRPRPDGIPAQFADLRNGPRDITRGLIAGGQESRLPLPRPDYAPPAFAGNMPRARPDMPQDVAALTSDQRLEPFTGPAPPVSPELAAAAGRATRPTDPFLTGLPAQGAIDQTAPASPIDPAAIAEARRTLQLHPDTGRIRTAPGFQQFNEPARTRPVPRQAEAPLIRPDLTQAAANYTPPTPRAPRPRPAEQFGPPMPMEAIGSDVPGPQSGLVRDSVSGKLYDPTASGGPAAPETPEEELARKTLIGRLRGEDDLIAGPEAGAINAGQPLPPPPETTVPPPIVEQQTIDDRPPLIAPSQDYANYAGPTAKSRRTGFLGNLIDREHFVGGPGLTGSPRTVGTNYTKSADPRRGKYKPAEHERLARNIGKTAGLLTSVVGVPPAVGVPLFGAAGAMINRARDPNRQVIERGPLRFFGGIFGGGLGRKDKKKSNDEKLGTPPSHEPAGVKEAAAAASRSGLGSDRGGFLGGGGMGSGGGYYGGGSFPGYGGYGGGYGPDSIGGAYHNR